MAGVAAQVVGRAAKVALAQGVKSFGKAGAQAASQPLVRRIGKNMAENAATAGGSYIASEGVPKLIGKAGERLSKSRFGIVRRVGERMKNTEQNLRTTEGGHITKSLLGMAGGTAGAVMLRRQMMKRGVTAALKKHKKA